MNKNNLGRLHFYRWIVWFILLMAYMIVVFQRVSLNAVSYDLQKEFNMTAFGFSVIASAFPYAYMIMQIPVGMAVDYMGSRKTSATGILITAFGSIIFSFAGNTWLLFLSRMLVGIGTATVFLSLLKIMINWFYSRQFASIYGMTQVISYSGGTVAQTPLVIIVGAIGWRLTYEIVAAICFMVFLAIFILVRDKPAEMGLPSVEALEGRKEIQVKTNIFNALKEVLRNRLIYPVIIGYASIYGSYIAFTGVWGIKYLTESSYQMSKIEAGNYSVTMTLGLALGSFIIGKLSDSTKKRRIFLILSSFIGTFGWAIIAFFKISGGIPLHMITFLIGCSSAFVIIAITYTKEVNDPNYSAIAASVTNFGGILGTAVLPMIIGVLYDMNQHLSLDLIWTKCIVMLFAINVIGFMASFFTKETGCQNIYSGSGTNPSRT